MAHDTLTKIIGLSTLGLVGYDILSNTEHQATRFCNMKQTKRLEDVYFRTAYTDTESPIQSTLNSWARSWHTSDNWLFKLFDNCTSRVSCFFSNVFENLSTLGLGAVALMTGRRFVASPGRSLNILQKAYNKCNIVDIPIINKVAAALLAIKAGSFVLHSLFGIGGVDYTKHNIH